MQVKILKSKLHMAAVTGAEMYYHGSLTVDPDLMDAVGLHPYELILVSNVANGARAETYVLPGERGAGQIELNGAMAHLGSVGDRIIVMAFALLEPHELPGHQPRVVALDGQNQITERLTYDGLEPGVGAPPPTTQRGDAART